MVISQDMTHVVGEITKNLASKRRGSKGQIAKFITVGKLGVGGRTLKPLGCKESTNSLIEKEINGQGPALFFSPYTFPPHLLWAAEYYSAAISI